MAIRQISSALNVRLKLIDKLLHDARVRRKSQNIVVEGIHLVTTLLEKNAAIDFALIAEEDLGHPEVAALHQRLQAMGVDLWMTPKTLFQTVSEVISGLGVLVVGKPPAPAPSKTQASSLALERVQDPGNLGAILRIAAATGIHNVHLSSGCASAWSPKVLRAGMGAHFSLAIHEDCDLLPLLQEEGRQVIAMTHNAPLSLYDCDLKGPVLWLFGSEGQGLSPTLLASATTEASIPQSRAVESLNVATAVAVCLFEMQRQCLVSIP